MARVHQLAVSLAVFLLGLNVAAQTPAAGDDPGQELPAATCGVVTVPGGLACVDADQASSWRVHHPSLWEDEKAYVEGGQGATPAGPVELGERLVYAVRADLLAFDLQRRQVVGRWRFPAKIAGLQAAGDNLVDVTLDYQPGRASASEVELTVRHRLDGRPPAQMQWSPMDFVQRIPTLREAQWLVADLDEEQVEQAVERLEQARRRDPTNPFYALLIGERRQAAGDDRGARQAFEQAAANEPAVWQDLLVLSRHLEEAGAQEPAQRAFEDGLAAMVDAGLEPRRMTTLLAPSLIFLGIQEPISAAVSEGDVERVDRLSARIAAVAPHVEGAPRVWRDLADWFDRHDRPQLAEQWRERASTAEVGAFNTVHHSVVWVDRMLNAIAGLALAILLISLLVGIRGGLARRRLREEESDKDHSLWVPLLRVRDIAAPLLLCVLMLPLPFVASVHLDVVGQLADAPIGVMNDAMAAPDVEQWLEERHESPARQKLLDIARAEREAVLAGEPVSDKIFTDELLYETIRADAQQTAKGTLTRGKIPDIFALADTQIGKDASALGPLAAVTGFVHIAILIFLGGIIGARLPRVGRWAVRLIPGGAARLAPFGGLVLALFSTAILAFFGLDSILSTVAQPNTARYFGLEAIAAADVTPSRLWAWAAIAVSIVVHVWAVRSGERS
jgi:hypothetical protein